MKILKIFGIVVTVHVFALILIFANPGCSSTSRPAPVPADTAAPTIAAAPATSSNGYYTSVGGETTVPAAVTFNPDAPATAAPSVRFTPMRPGSAAASAVNTPPVANVTSVTTYVVKSGDSLWAIARKHGVTVGQLTAANNLGGNSLQPGQKLLIPSKNEATAPVATMTPAPATKSAAPSPSARSASDGTMRHVVKSGESLGVIARQYGVKTGDIAVANNIADPARIRAGMELVIPGWQPAGARKSGPTKSASPSTAAPTERLPENASPSAPPATIQIDPAPASAPFEPAPTPQVPVIQIDEGPVTPRGGQ